MSTRLNQLNISQNEFENSSANLNPESLTEINLSSQKTAVLSIEILLKCISETSGENKMEIKQKLNSEISFLTRQKPSIGFEQTEIDKLIQSLSTIYQQIKPRASESKNTSLMYSVSEILYLFENLKCDFCHKMLQVSSLFSKIKNGKSNRKVLINFPIEIVDKKHENSVNLLSLNSSIFEIDNPVQAPLKSILEQQKTDHLKIDEKNNTLSDSCLPEQLALKSLFSRSINNPQLSSKLTNIHSINSATYKFTQRNATDSVNVIFDKVKLDSHKKRNSDLKKRSESENSKENYFENSNTKYFLRKQSADATLKMPEINRVLLAGYDSFESLSGVHIDDSRMRNSNNFDSLSDINLRKIFSKKLVVGKITCNSVIVEESISKEKHTSNKKATDSENDSIYQLTPYDPFGLQSLETDQFMKTIENESIFAKHGEIKTGKECLDFQKECKNEELLLDSFEDSFANNFDKQNSFQEISFAKTKNTGNFQINQQIKKENENKIDHNFRAESIILQGNLDLKLVCSKNANKHMELSTILNSKNEENRLKSGYISPRNSNLIDFNPCSKGKDGKINKKIEFDSNEILNSHLRSNKTTSNFWPKSETNNFISKNNDESWKTPQNWLIVQKPVEKIIKTPFFGKSSEKNQAEISENIKRNQIKNTEADYKNQGNTNETKINNLLIKNCEMENRTDHSQQFVLKDKINLDSIKVKRVIDGSKKMFEFKRGSKDDIDIIDRAHFKTSDSRLNRLQTKKSQAQFHLNDFNAKICQDRILLTGRSSLLNNATSQTKSFLQFKGKLVENEDKPAFMKHKDVSPRLNNLKPASSLHFKNLNVKNSVLLNQNQNSHPNSGIFNFDKGILNNNFMSTLNFNLEKDDFTQANNEGELLKRVSSNPKLQNSKPINSSNFRSFKLDPTKGVDKVGIEANKLKGENGYKIQRDKSKMQKLDKPKFTKSKVEFCD